MTYIQVINNVLRQLREDTATSVTDNEYTTLIGQFVNQVIDEMEDAHDWYRQIRYVPFTIPAGSSSCALVSTNAEVTGTYFTNERSGLVYDERSRPLVFDVTDSDVGYQLRQENRRAYNREFALMPRDTRKPTSFAVDRDDNDGWTLRFDSKMEVERSFGSYWYIPRTAYALDGTDDNLDMLLPTRPIIMGTLFYAYNERGEEMGEPGNLAERRYIDALGAAIENDDREGQQYLYRNFTNNEVY